MSLKKEYKKSTNVINRFEYTLRNGGNFGFQKSYNLMNNESVNGYKNGVLLLESGNCFHDKFRMRK